MVALLDSETTCEKRSVSCISKSYAEVVMCDLGLSSQLKLACNSVVMKVTSFFDLENTNSELKNNANQTTRLREKQFGALLGIEVVQQFAGPCGM
ncbi:hypothetical protein MKW98_006410, partial [Papaver atlanticum]